MIRKYTLFLFLLLASFSGWAQPMCGTDVLHQNLLNQNSTLAAQVQQSNTEWSQYSQLLNNSLVIGSGNDTIYEIPVVVHIMHTGGAIGSIYNPTDAQIIGMINYLNQSYAATYSGYPDTNNGGVNIPIRFKLAQRDPNCNATTGITRVNLSSNSSYVSGGVQSSSSSGISDVTLKNYERWPVHDYYNIWIVNKIDGADGTIGTFTAGFAYLPPNNPADRDGCVMLATQSIAGEITLPHEVGHSMGLYHVFQGGSTTVCPNNTNCSTNGDLVCDTEPQRQSTFNCPTGINPCTGVAYQNGPNNFMDYSNCQNRFTAGQRTRALYILKTYRSGLLSSLGGTPPVSTSLTAASCTTSITAANANNANNMGPVNVVLNNLQASSGGYGDDGNLAYVDRTCSQSATVEMGQSYPISVSTYLNMQNVRVYIDYDNDGTFNTSTELVYSHNGIVSGNETHTGTITIPTTSTLACSYRRMRVIADFANNTSITPCGTLQYGQGEDYLVYFKPANSSATVNIALTSGTNPTCIGSALTFTATPSANAQNPTYKWYVNGVFTNVTTSTYTSSSLANNSVVTVLMNYTTSGGCAGDSATSNAITIQTATNAPATVTIALTSGSLPTCAGLPLTFTATPSNGGSAPTYQWYNNGAIIPGATNVSYTTSTYNNNDVITASMISNSSCASPNSDTSTGITITTTTATQTPSVSIALVSGSNPSCTGTTLVFAATPVNGGTAPVYQWKINGVAVIGANASTFTTTMVNGAVISVDMVSNNPCASTGTVTSNTVTLIAGSVTPSVTIAVTGGTNPGGCPGDTLTYTATAVNGGANPYFQWNVNGFAQSGANGPTFTTSLLSAGDVISVTMVSTDSCASPAIATSNTDTISYTLTSPDVVIALSGGSTNPTCAGTVVNLTATSTNAGTAPTYLWFINGAATTFTGSTFSSSTLSNGDQISCVVTSNNPCSSPTTDTSNIITMTITPLDTPGISVNYTAGGNPGCVDSLMEFNVSALTPGGTVTGFEIYLNGVLVSNTTFSSATLVDGDVIIIKMFVTGAGCRVGDTATEVINVVRYAAPPAPVISFIGNMLVANTSYPVQWYGPNGLIVGADSIAYHPTEPGTYYCIASNNGCASVLSNKLKVSLLDIANMSNGNAAIYPNPTTGELVIDWGKNMSSATIDVYSMTGQRLMQEIVNNVSKKTISLGDLANGNYFIITHDEKGNFTTSKITLSK